MWWESINKVYGITVNAYNERCIVGGSSGGEACALSACFGFFGLGSDIGGSIRMPAHFNGICGHKPSNFLVPNEGQFPIGKNEINRLLCTGPFSRSVEDLYPLLLTLSKKGFESKIIPYTDIDLKNFNYSSNKNLKTKICKNLNQKPASLSYPPNISYINKDMVIYYATSLPIPFTSVPDLIQQEAIITTAKILAYKYGCRIKYIDFNNLEEAPIFFPKNAIYINDLA